MGAIFENVFENSPVAKIIVGQNGKIKLVNKQTETLFQYSRSELIGKDVSLLTPKEIRSEHPQLMKEYFSSPYPRQMGAGRNLKGLKKDGSLFPVEVGLTPINDGEELLIMSSIIDITERINAKERFESAVESAPNGMIMINQNGKIVLANKATENIFGYKRIELIDFPIEKLVPDEFTTPHPSFVKAYVKNPVPRAMGTGRELFGKHKSGKLIPVEIGLQPLVFGNETYVISSIVDISERKKAEKEIEEKSEEIREFSYRTSHDLKTPLLSVGGLLDFIIEDTKEGDLESVIDGGLKAKKLVKKLNILIDDILDLTRADVNQEDLIKFNFKKYLKDVTTKFEYIMTKNHVTLDHSLNHNLDLFVQNTRLTQVLDNLISNSIKYYNEKKEKRFVKIITKNDNKKFYIEIEDNGLGIPKNKHDQVFGMFQRFHEHQVEGSGLGLYMIKKHVEKMNAEISFDSSEAGTIFKLEFFC